MSSGGVLKDCEARHPHTLDINGRRPDSLHQSQGIVLALADISSAKMPPKMKPTERIANAILTLHGQKVLLDASLATLYGVTTKALNQAVRRNRARFPADFMFRLTVAEDTNLRSQSVTSSSRRHGGRRNRPYAFTEQGVAMLSSVLKSPRAIAVNIEIRRAFVHLRATLAAHAELSQRLDGLEQKYDGQFRSVFQAIRLILEPPSQPQRRIGFRRQDHTHSTRA